MFLLLAAVATVPSPPSKWTVDFGNSYCQASRTFGGDVQPTTLFIRPSLDPLATTKLILDREIKSLSGDPMSPARLDFGDGEEPWGTQLQAGLSKEGFHYQVDLPANQARRLRQSSALTVSSSAKVSGRYDLSPIAPVFRALDRCVADLLQRIGVDASRVLSSPPVPTAPLKGLFSSSHYWTAEVRRAAKNRVTVSMLIDRSGKVRDCALVESTGSEAIDTQTCQILRLKVSYRPARDQSGAPVAVLHRETIDWHR